MEPMNAPAAESPANWKRHTAGELELEGFGIIALEELGLGGLGFVSRSVSEEEESEALEESKVAIFYPKISAFSRSLVSNFPCGYFTLVFGRSPDKCICLS